MSHNSSCRAFYVTKKNQFIAIKAIVNICFSDPLVLKQYRKVYSGTVLGLRNKTQIA